MLAEHCSELGSLISLMKQVDVLQNTGERDIHLNHKVHSLYVQAARSVDGVFRMWPLTTCIVADVRTAFRDPARWANHTETAAFNLRGSSAVSIVVQSSTCAL